MAESAVPDAFEYAAHLVREQDYDRYLCAAVAPPPERIALLAVTAFNFEIAKTREAVSEPMLGEIRLQWWRETIESIYAGTPRKHQVVDALTESIQRFDLPRAPFDALIDAREDDLEEAAPASLAELEKYAADTSATLLRLWCAVLGAPPGETVDRIGTAWALVGLLRAAPFHAQRQRRYIPDEVLAETGLRERDYFDLRSSAALSDSVRRIAYRAADILEGTHGPAPPLQAMVRLCALYLRRLEKAEHDPFGSRVEPGPLRKQIRVLTGL